MPAALLAPSDTLMDVNIGTALWLAARAEGILIDPDGPAAPSSPTDPQQLFDSPNASREGSSIQYENPGACSCNATEQMSALSPRAEVTWISMDSPAVEGCSETECNQPVAFSKMELQTSEAEFASSPASAAIPAQGGSGPSTSCRNSSLQGQHAVTRACNNTQSNSHTPLHLSSATPSCVDITSESLQTALLNKQAGQIQTTRHAAVNAQPAVEQLLHEPPGLQHWPHSSHTPSRSAPQHEPRPGQEPLADHSQHVDAGMHPAPAVCSKEEQGRLLCHASHQGNAHSQHAVEEWQQAPLPERGNDLQRGEQQSSQAIEVMSAASTQPGQASGLPQQAIGHRQRRREARRQRDREAKTAKARKAAVQAADAVTHQGPQVRSAARVVLLGQGADEQCAG